MPTTRSQTRRPTSQRSPDFASGVIDEPLLAFGGGHEHVDPKTGLALYGPYSSKDQPRPGLTSFTVGIIGTAAMISDARAWLRACGTVVTNDGHEPFQWPHFPGFNAGHPFQCEVILGEAGWEDLREEELRVALAEPNFYERIRRIVHLYTGKIEVLAGRDPRPDVILCCIPQPVIDVCATRTTRGGEIERRRIPAHERAAQVAAAMGQGFLFSQMDPRLGIEGEGGTHENLRRGLKAEAMRFGIPTQLVWPATLSLIDTPSAGGRGVQDRATRAWNFMTALYHKAGGSPWRLAQVEPGTCFIGISFYKEIGTTAARMRTSLAQAFTAAGDGYVLRGESFGWDERAEHTNSPHLDRRLAATLMRDVLMLYKHQNRGALPTRIVVHKSSRYWEDELAGFTDACEYVPRHDFIALGGRGLQFYRTGEYPPLRGTYVKFDDTDLLLYTTGYVPFLRTYPGPRVPQPLEVLEHYGDSPWEVVLREIQALTKMNWNTANFSTSEPVTVAFAQRVGQILAELPPDIAPRPEYRFYM